MSGCDDHGPGYSVVKMIRKYSIAAKFKQVDSKPEIGSQSCVFQQLSLSIV